MCKQSANKLAPQDELPPLPPDISPDMASFLSQCFQKDQARRPSARELLRHQWVMYHRATLRTSWSRTQGLKARGVRTDAHISVSAAVEHMLQVSCYRAAGAVRDTWMVGACCMLRGGVWPHRVQSDAARCLHDHGAHAAG